MSKNLEFRDPSDLPEMSYSRHPMEDLEPIDEPMVSAFKAAGAIRYVISRGLDAKDSKLELKCMGLAAGITFVGNSEVEIARDHGVTRQDVSKRVRDFQELHGISGAVHNKRSGSRAKYRLANSRRTKIR